MMGQTVLRGYTVDYDGEEAIVSVGGKVVERFTTDEQATALVKAQRFIKGQKVVEIDKGVFDLDEQGNVIELKLMHPSDKSRPVGDAIKFDEPEDK